MAALDSDMVVAFASFDDMPLHAHVLRGVYSYGFETPSAIQQRSIVPIIKGKDVIAQAQSGTGKTGAFTIGLLQRIDWRHDGVVQAVVVSPTRELAQQTHDVMKELGSFASERPCSLFTGGTRVVEDAAKLQAGTAVAVGTPGRLADLIRRGTLQTSHLRTIVLDEADEMLSQGFADQVYDIFRYLPKSIQICLFSATMPQDVLDLASKFMRAPTRILLPPEQQTLEGIRQFFVSLPEESKLAALMDLYETVSIAQSVIFANTKRKVEWIAGELNRHNHTVSAMHADMSRAERDAVMSAFRSGSSRVLVTTDLVARGIDVQHVNYVVNFDVPLIKENYIHRIGRSGRYGRRGIAINLVAERDVPALKDIEAHYQIEIAELPQNFADHLSEQT